MSIAKDVNEKLDEILMIRREIKRMDHDLDDDVQLKNMETGGTTNKEEALRVVEAMIDQIKAELSQITNNGQNVKDVFTNNYYVNESVGIASGFLLAALHNAGLATLTHTPSPMNFLGKILDRPENEKAYLLIPVGYPSEKAEVPNIKKKPFSEISKKV